MGTFPPPPSPEPSFGSLRDFVDASVDHKVMGLSVTFQESVLAIVGVSSVPQKMTRKVREAIQHWFTLNQRTPETVMIDIRRPEEQ